MRSRHSLILLQSQEASSPWVLSHGPRMMSALVLSSSIDAVAIRAKGFRGCARHKDSCLLRTCLNNTGIHSVFFCAFAQDNVKGCLRFLEQHALSPAFMSVVNMPKSIDICCVLASGHNIMPKDV